MPMCVHCHKLVINSIFASDMIRAENSNSDTHILQSEKNEGLISSVCAVRQQSGCSALLTARQAVVFFGAHTCVVVVVIIIIIK